MLKNSILFGKIFERKKKDLFTLFLSFVFNFKFNIWNRKYI